MIYTSNVSVFCIATEFCQPYNLYITKVLQFKTIKINSNIVSYNKHLYILARSYAQQTL